MECRQQRQTAVGGRAARSRRRQMCESGSPARSFPKEPSDIMHARARLKPRFASASPPVLRALAFALLFGAPLAFAPALAGPEGGKVVSGTADIAQTSPKRLDISGNIDFDGDAGSGERLGAVTVDKARNVTIATSMNAASFTQREGTGTTDFGTTHPLRRYFRQRPHTGHPRQGHREGHHAQGPGRAPAPS